MSVGQSWAYRQRTAAWFQPIWALSFPTDVRLVLFREIKLQQQAPLCQNGMVNGETGRMGLEKPTKAYLTGTLAVVL